MKITFVTVNFEVSARTKRALLRVVLPVAVFLGAGGIAYASLPHTFASGEVLTAANLNNNFQSLDTRVAALEGHETNGSRLTARYTTTTEVGADGAQQVTKYFAGWFDTQRNEYCFPTLASDGPQRCLPSESGGPGAGGVSSGSSGIYYSDGACTKRVIRVTLDPICATMPSCSDCNPPAPKYYRDPASACGASAGVRVFPVGQPLQLTSYYTKLPAGACATSYPSATDRWYDASASVEIPPATFVAFTVTSQTQ